MEIIFTMDKETKNTIRFTEVLENEFDEPKVGTLYVQKTTLDELEWEEGMRLSVNIDLE
jgi:hypothetical protein